MNQYTDTSLKQALAKLLPTEIETFNGHLKWTSKNQHYPAFVEDTELLHLCWLVEETLEEHQPFEDALTSRDPCIIYPYHATWQQRVISLCKVKGIEL